MGYTKDNVIRSLLSSKSHYRVRDRRGAAGSRGLLAPTEPPHGPTAAGFGCRDAPSPHRGQNGDTAPLRSGHNVGSREHIPGSTACLEDWQAQSQLYALLVFPCCSQYLGDDFGVEHVFSVKRNSDAVIISAVNAMTTLGTNKLKTSTGKPMLGFFRIQLFLLRRGFGAGYAVPAVPADP
ncbi:hypothetical protein SAMN05920897_1484 [Alkalispirochaeta americana]|uniref:Uncharacterized protein n=1 Tax=Alkalispirochaeta americana TaxID=159291 RepID=A0A1N6YCH1_9SPIO|nr:hypothetical protein SAMN05920897_1484 [Alkalispirochaeta americana]